MIHDHLTDPEIIVDPFLELGAFAKFVGTNSRAAKLVSGLLRASRAKQRIRSAKSKPGVVMEGETVRSGERDIREAG